MRKFQEDNSDLQGIADKMKSLLLKRRCHCR
jgi:hypothetical protein